jgi:hypothetical protein
MLKKIKNQQKVSIFSKTPNLMIVKLQKIISMQNNLMSAPALGPQAESLLSSLNFLFPLVRHTT